VKLYKKLRERSQKPKYEKVRDPYKNRDKSKKYQEQLDDSGLW